jgi:uridine kinase
MDRTVRHPPRTRRRRSRNGVKAVEPDRGAALTRTAAVEQLAAVIAALRPLHPARVAIDGVDGAGKTTLADELVQPLRRAGREVIRASIDGFHNPREVRYARGPDSPEGYFLDSFDYGAVRRELLDPLGPVGDGRFRTAVFDYRTDRTVESPRQSASREAVLLFDGVFLSRPELEGSWDITVWLDVPFDVTIERAIARDSRRGTDAASTRAKYEHRYVPGQRLYLAQCHPLERADIVLYNSDLDRPKVVIGARSRKK